MDIRIENFTKRFDKTTVIEDLSLSVRDGEMMALLGPSGCGKSTTLFAICGVYTFDEGRLFFGDRDVTALASQKRNVGVVFQSFALYPHLTVAQNIGFPLKVRGESRADIDRQVRGAAAMVRVSELLERRPGQLSGGQQQRVALARALIRRPDVLLMDEPLANLDAKLRLDMRTEIRRLQQETGITAILVTHDQVEAMSMCDRIAIMKQGRILQIAAPRDMYDGPDDTFVAGFLGNPPINFVETQVVDGHCQTAHDTVRVPLPERLIGLPAGAKLTLGVRPEFVQPGHDTRFTGRITFIESQGREDLFDLELEDGTMLRSIQSVGAAVGVGEAVEWGISPRHVLFFDAEGRRL